MSANSYRIERIADRLRIDSERGIPKPQCDSDFIWWDKIFNRKDEIDSQYIHVETVEALQAYIVALQAWLRYVEDVLSIYYSPPAIDRKAS